MCRLRWLLLIAVCAGVVAMSDSLLAGQNDEDSVREAVLLRFDENRNDKLDLGEAKQARARLRTLLEDKSSREINILTWREDIHDVLRAMDQDGDHRFTVDERDDAVQQLNRIIPQVDSDSENFNSTTRGSAQKKSSASDNSDRRGHRSRSRLENGGVHGSSLGGGGFGNSMGNTVTSSGSSFHGYGNSFGGVGGTGGSSDVRSSSSGRLEFVKQQDTKGLETRSVARRPNSDIGPLTDSPSNRAIPTGGGKNTAVFPSTNSPRGMDSKSPGARQPDGLAGSDGGVVRPKKSSSSGGPTLTPPIAKPNF